MRSRTVVHDGSPALLLADSVRPRDAEAPALTLALHPGDRVGLWWEAPGGERRALLRTLARLQRPAEGRLLWQGVDVTRRPRLLLPSKQRRAIVLIWSDPYALFEDNVRIGSLIGEADPPSGSSGADQVDGGRLSPAPRGFRVSSLSGVERVRLALAYAVQRTHMGPDVGCVILVDDLFSQLVPESWPKLLNDLDQAAGETGALLIASRYVQVVQVMHRVYDLRDGEFVEHGQGDN